MIKHLVILLLFIVIVSCDNNDKGGMNSRYGDSKRNSISGYDTSSTIKPVLDDNDLQRSGTKKLGDKVRESNKKHK
jgi:hypothetical protein